MTGVDWTLQKIDLYINNFLEQPDWLISSYPGRKELQMRTVSYSWVYPTKSQYQIPIA